MFVRMHCIYHNHLIGFLYNLCDGYPPSLNDSACYKYSKTLSSALRPVTG